jgi:hypothetical protein
VGQLLDFKSRNEFFYGYLIAAIACSDHQLHSRDTSDKDLAVQAVYEISGINAAPSKYRSAHLYQ